MTFGLFAQAVSPPTLVVGLNMSSCDIHTNMRGSASLAEEQHKYVGAKRHPHRMARVGGTGT